jgi:hypothetical protein
MFGSRLYGVTKKIIYHILFGFRYSYMWGNMTLPKRSCIAFDKQKVQSYMHALLFKQGFLEAGKNVFLEAEAIPAPTSCS